MSRSSQALGRLGGRLSRSKKKQQPYKLVVVSPPPIGGPASAPKRLELPPVKLKRGDVVTALATNVKRTPYSWEDLCAACEMARDGVPPAEVTVAYPAIPRASIRRWRRDDAVTMKGKTGRSVRRGVKGREHWDVEKNLRRRTTMPRNGVPPTLGGAEKALTVEFARAAQANCSYSAADVATLLR